MNEEVAQSIINELIKTYDGKPLNPRIHALLLRTAKEENLEAESSHSLSRGNLCATSSFIDFRLSR